MKRSTAIFLVAFVWLGFTAPARAIETKAIPLAPTEIDASTTRNIVDALLTRHYGDVTLDDAQSVKIFNAYLEDLDPSRSYFLASDINQFDKYRSTLDDSLREGDTQPAYVIFKVYHRRVEDRFRDVIATLQKGLGQFDFTKQESVELDRKKAPWATSTAALNDLWRKRIKEEIISLKLTDKTDAEIQKLLVKRYKDRLDRSKQTNSDDVYQLYMNSFTRTFDPHTQYFSPRTSENFNINMSLSLEGIGAVLQRDDEYTKIVSLVPGGPADKSKALHPGDRVIGVGQGKQGDLVNVIGWRLDEVVQLIRGKKGTVVRLHIMRSGAKDPSDAKIVDITRNTVELEEQSAKSEVMKVKLHGVEHKIGVINVPTFYLDFKAYQEGSRDYKSTTRDVRRLLKGLQNKGIEGLVIDLRSDGGGSLQEAKTLAGLFIDYGPVVQIRSRSDRVDVLYDRDPRVFYSGPIVILVNRLSASASEIFAGAMQDYQRGIIVGSRTFGKGTVQSLIPVGHGQLKITQAKFYRITGKSTQFKGVTPDITFPPDYDPKSIGESTMEDPLPWDKITPTRYQLKGDIVDYLPTLRKMHKARISHDPKFQYLAAASERRREDTDEKSISLNLTTRKQEKANNDAFWLALENSKRIQEGKPAIKSLDDLNKKKSPHLAQNDTPAAGITSPDKGKGKGKDKDKDKNKNKNARTDKKPSDLEVNELASAPALKAEHKGQPSVPPQSEDTIKEKPDAYLIEAGEILLNSTVLHRRAVADSKKAKATNPAG